MKFTYKDIPITYKGISEMTYDIYGESKHFSKDILLEIPGDKLRIWIKYKTNTIHFCSVKKPDCEDDGEMVHTLRNDFQNFVTFLFAKSLLRVVLMHEFPEISFTLNKGGFEYENEHSKYFS